MAAHLGPILVTGAAGYLGAHVLNAIYAAGGAATGASRDGRVGLACDLLDRSALRALLAAVRPAVVVHCAAERVGSYDDTAAAARSVQMTRHLAEAGVQRLVHISSMTVYAPTQPMPAREETTDPQSAYGLGKREAERVLEAAGGLAATILRLPGLFGAPRRGGLVQQLCRAAALGLTPSLPAAPVMWAAMHVEDAASVVARAALRPAAPTSILNVGYPGPHSINRLVALVAQASGAPLATQVAHPVFEMDLSRLNAAYGPAPGSLPERIRIALATAAGGPPTQSTGMEDAA
ncbi:NAD-dependent epimerase/dehydratase family protein [Sediminicoccus rosea]|uniref:NAD(P)-dependent oxidoreductase n=1 Tax=Sediminicoccus rosea TaxID=1225128 RepID=A0ABZ0PNZ3_9PROT|nr:NAD(P)-dependent oxidoreductase [Sediminicoccus rosea]WPB87453.1 NAD(P)-dependent oxidoreductase [Sediminicoccus rosea]